MCSERPEIVASSLSASYSFLPPLSLFLSLFLRLPLSILSRARGGRWTFTRQRSAFRRAAIIAYCARENCRWDNPFERPRPKSHNKAREVRRESRGAVWLFNAARQRARQITMRSLRRVTQRTRGSRRVLSVPSDHVESRSSSSSFSFQDRRSWLKYARACTPACPSLRNARDSSLNYLTARRPPILRSLR